MNSRRARSYVALALAALSACTEASPALAPTTPAPNSTNGPSGANATPSADISSLLQPLVTAWRPSGPTVIAELSRRGAVMLAAVPLGGGPPTPLARLTDLSGSVPARVGWDVRSDGSALVLAVATSATSSRLAVLDLARGEARWLTPELGLHDATPEWSLDGRSVYFGRWDLAGDKGVLRVAADGTSLTTIRGPAPSFALSSVARVTPENVLLGADEYNGPVPFALDLSTGHERSFGVRNAVVVAWRAARPRALVGVLMNIVAPGGGYLALWDDVDGTVKTILTGYTRGADFDPSGRHVVAAAPFSETDPRPRLVVMDTDGSRAMPLAGTEDALMPLWLEAGIVYVVQRGNDGPSELRLVSPSGGTPGTLYTADGRITSVRAILP